MTPAEATAVDAKLAAVLPDGSLFAVGGRVRDEVRSALDGAPLTLKDLDYVAVGLQLDDLVARLRTIGRADVVGAAFAVVKCTLPEATVDVALPRRERSTGVGHRDFEVHAGADVPLEDDLARRDFRMNMLARAIGAGEIVDPYDGRADIEARRIDILRPEAFEEDPLRMLRACQFAARFEYGISPATMTAMRAAAPLVATVSPERVRDELLKLLTANRPSIGFEAMREGGLLAVLLPEIQSGVGVEQNEWHAYDVYTHTMATLDAAPPGDLLVRLAALFHDVGKPQTKDGPRFYRHEVVGEGVTREVLSRLRFSNETVDVVARLVRGHMFVADPAAKASTVRRFMRRVGPENVDRLFALRAADVAGSGLPKRDDRNERFADRVHAIAAERPPLSARDLAVDGNEVVALLIEHGALAPGSKGGPAVGRILAELLDRVVDDPALNDPAKLLDAARALAAAASQPNRPIGQR